MTEGTLDVCIISGRHVEHVGNPGSHRAEQLFGGKQCDPEEPMGSRQVCSVGADIQVSKAKGRM